MPSFGGGGGQTVPATFSQGANPAPYQPAGQPAADTSYQTLMQGLINPSLSFLNQNQPFPAVQQYPEAQYLANLVTQNPYFGNAQQAAGLGAQYGTAAGTQAYNTGMGTFPFLAGNVTGGVPGLQSAGNQILNTAFDPQSAIYNQLSGEVQDRTNAQLAMSGLSGTPYGAGLANDAMQNFMTNWQNQQLARQAQGISGANQAFQGVGGLEQIGANILGQGANLANMGAQGVYQAGQLPYQQLNQFANQGTSALGNLVQLGNQQYTLPQQTLNDLQSYLNLGQAASGLAGQLGNQGFNQNMMSGLGTAGLLGGGANLAFGNSLANNGGLLGLAGLSPFGSAGALSPADFASGGVASGLFDFGGAGAAGGGLDLSSLLLPAIF